MNDETIKNIFRVTVSPVEENFASQGRDAKERMAILSAREKYYNEFAQFLKTSLTDIIARGRQQETVSRDFYEREMTDLLAKISKSISDIRDESFRQTGLALAFENASEQLKTLSNVLNAEITKARDLQARAESGELGKRKPGTRPDRIRDVRNYVESEKDK